MKPRSRYGMVSFSSLIKASIVTRYLTRIFFVWYSALHISIGVLHILIEGVGNTAGPPATSWLQKAAIPLYKLPLLLLKICPLILFMGMLGSIWYLKRSQQWLALRIGGFTPLHLLRPFLKSAFFCTLFTLVCIHPIAFKGLRHLKALEQTYVLSPPSSWNVLYAKEYTILWNAKTWNTAGEAQGIRLYVFNQEGEFEHAYYATSLAPCSNTQGSLLCAFQGWDFSFVQPPQTYGKKLLPAYLSSEKLKEPTEVFFAPPSLAVPFQDLWARRNKAGTAPTHAMAFWYYIALLPHCLMMAYLGFTLMIWAEKGRRMVLLPLIAIGAAGSLHALSHLGFVLGTSGEMQKWLAAFQPVIVGICIGLGFQMWDAHRTKTRFLSGFNLCS